MAESNSTAIPTRVKDLTGQVFGKWTVIGFAGLSKRKQATWLCRCECGTEAIVMGTALNCHRSEKCLSCARRKHGMRDSPEYHAWSAMRQRCLHSGSPQFARYGGRGITVCERWQHSFQAFYNDIGLRPSPRHSIHRIDNDGHYTPENCKWATPEEQGRARSTNRVLTFDGTTMCLAEWAEQYGLRRDTLRERLRRGWSLERALTTPVR